MKIWSEPHSRHFLPAVHVEMHPCLGRQRIGYLVALGAPPIARQAHEYLALVRRVIDREHAVRIVAMGAVATLGHGPAYAIAVRCGITCLTVNLAHATTAAPRQRQMVLDPPEG